MDEHGQASQVDEPGSKTADDYSTTSGAGSIEDTVTRNLNVPPSTTSKGDMSDTEEKKQTELTESGHHGVSGLETLQPLPGWRFALLGLGICLGLFLAMLDTSIVATCLYSIAAEFDALDAINWVALAYTLTYLSFAVLFARISDVIGRRATFMVSFLIFIAFSLGCGFAKNLNQLIVCRALQGVGGSGLYSIGIILFPELTPDDRKKFIAGIIGIVIAMSGVLGPVLGGLLTHYRSWRWVFWMNGPIGAFSAVVFWFTWPGKEYIPDMERRKWKDLDYVGSFLLIMGSVLICFAFQNAGLDVAQWDKVIFIFPVILGVLSFLVFFVWEYEMERRRGGKLALAMPLTLLRNHVYTAGALNTMFLGFPYFMCIYSFPIRFQVVHRKSALEAGLMLLPMLAASASGSAIAGVISGKKNRLFETLLAACLLMLVGCALETMAAPSAIYEPKVLGFLVFIGIGFGLSASASTMLGAIESPIREHAPAQGMIAQLRILGGSMGIASSSAILGTKIRNDLANVLTPEQIKGLAAQEPTLSAEQYAAIRQTYTDALKQDMIVCTAVLAAAFFVTFGVYRRGRISVDEKQAQRVAQERERRLAARRPADTSGGA